MESIQLDCPPGATRPGDLIEGVLEGTGLVSYDVTPFFGMAQWEFDVPRERWVAEIQPIIKPRIVALYNEGLIRYGGW